MEAAARILGILEAFIQSITQLQPNVSLVFLKKQKSEFELCNLVKALYFTGSLV